MKIIVEAYKLLHLTPYKIFEKCSDGYPQFKKNQRRGFGSFLREKGIACPAGGHKYAFDLELF